MAALFVTTEIRGDIRRLRGVEGMANGSAHSYTSSTLQSTSARLGGG